LRTPAGASASVLLVPMIDGPVRDLHISHRGRIACQLADDEGTVVACVITRDSIRLPHAVVVPSFPRGSPLVSVGDGTLGWDGSRVSVSRWWSPRRPDLPELRSLIDESAVARFSTTWSASIGRGLGLTPYDDDVVCGTLVTLHAAGHPATAALSAEVMAAPLVRRTTATSAALLRLAAHGYCIDQLADYLAALIVGDRPITYGPHPATDRLLAVGHSSGHGLIRGVTSLLVPETVEAVA
jgi:hypothetical protein